MSNPSRNAATTTADLYAHLRDEKVKAYVADTFEESMIMVPAFEKLALLQDRDFAVEHYMFVEDAPGVFILCRRDGEVTEATFNYPGVLSHKCIMPFDHWRDFTNGPNWAPNGHQYVVVTMPGLDDMEGLQQAISNIHVMARLRHSEGKLRPLTELNIDGEDAILASAPLGTPAVHALPSDVSLALTHQQDPHGHVAQYAHQRSLMVLEDNQVDVYLAAHLEKAGMYELHGGTCGALLRPGQIVRVEVGFRIVPAGRQVMLRMDLKSVTIINDNIVATMAFAEADSQSTRVRRTIAVSSSGPHGIVVPNKPRIKRATRQRKNMAKDKEEPMAVTMDELPFAKR